MKKIVIVINDLKGNGAERVVISLAELFRERGHESHIVIFKNQVELPLDDDQSLHFFPAGKFRWIPRRVRGAVLAPFFDAFVRRKIGVPDLVLSNLIPADRILAHSRLSNVCFIIHNTLTHEMSNYFPDRKEVELKARIELYRRKRCVCVSQGVMEDLSLYLKNHSRIHQIYSPIDRVLIEKSAAQNPKSRVIKGCILHVGKFNEAKRQDLLVRAYAQSKSEAPLVLVGQGPHKKAVEDLVEELGLSERVFFTGFQENPYPQMSSARMFVLCSDFEGLGMVILEALALGVPVISTDCPSGPSEILPAKNLCPPSDIVALSQLIAVADQDPDSFSCPLPDKFCRDRVVSQYLNLIE